VQGTLGDDRGRWVLSSAHGEAESDVSLSAWMDGRLQQAKVDRTFVCDGERWLIDYRTASHEGGDRERFLQAEVELLRPDLLRAGRLMQLIDERPLRIGVYFPLLQAWRELAPTGESVGRAGR
jgi:ATP-dependent helicase/nuclease subunit A